MGVQAAKPATIRVFLSFNTALENLQKLVAAVLNLESEMEFKDRRSKLVNKYLKFCARDRQ